MLRSTDILSDSRVLRYEEWFLKHQISYRIVGWDRVGKIDARGNTVYYRGRAGFQQRTKAIINRIKWNLFLVRYLIAHRSEYQVIHACDFDTVMPAMVMKVFGRKIVFDIFDWFSDEVRTGKFFIDKTINRLEKAAAKSADMDIICEEERLAQMKVRPKKYTVISNIPQIDLPEETERRSSEDERIHIVYVGGLVKDRGLEELLETVSGLSAAYTLDIAGYGDERLEKLARAVAESHENISFLGKVPYKTALQIMQKADILYAMYYTSNANHIYAAPNKFYESIILGKPLITTQGTLVGDKVKREQNGFVLAEGTEALKKFLGALTRDDIEDKKMHIMMRQKEYAGLFDRQMKKYLMMIENL